MQNLWLTINSVVNCFVYLFVCFVFFLLYFMCNPHIYYKTDQRMVGEQAACPGWGINRMHLNVFDAQGWELIYSPDDQLLLQPAI